MQVNGVLLVDKPKKMTSHDVVYLLRRKLNIKKIGHAGTLDPEATGLLILLIGKATKLSQQFLQLDKLYRTKITLGVKTATGDSSGQVIQSEPVPNYEHDQLQGAILSFQGEGLQIPPMVSAKKVGGKKLYVLARRGIVIERKPQKINIFKIKITNIDLPDIYFDISCSKGTYIRTLAEDIGQRLGTVAYMSGLRRLACGPYKVEDAIGTSDIDVLEKEDIIKRFIGI